MDTLTQQEKEHGHGQKYFLDIEGVIHEWSESTITMEQIAKLGGWNPTDGVIEIDRENVERTLKPGEVVEIKPGQGFAKKVHWKRGLFEDRLAEEARLLRECYPDTEIIDRWVRVPSYLMPPGWAPAQNDICIHVRDEYIALGPYGIYVPVGLRFQGSVPGNYTEPANVRPPFTGVWGVLSWQAEGWRASPDVRKGSNLLTWVRGIATRFSEGS